VDAERLAAYLAGELDADETAALEAALARDTGLRAQLTAMRRADEVLAALPRTELPEGFERRLHAAVDAELAAQRHAATGAATDGAATEEARTTRRADELASRRERRGWSWLPAFAGAAAAVAVLGAVVIGLGPLGAGDDTADTMMTLDADDADGAEEEMATEALPGPGEAPTIVAADRDLDEALADELLASVELQAVADQALGADPGRSIATAWGEALRLAVPGSFEMGTTAAPDAMEDDGEADEDTDTGADPGEEVAGTHEQRTFGPVRLLADGALEEEDGAAVTRCLDEVLAGGVDAIPAYVELATFGGEEVVVLGLVTFDPAKGGFTRPEVWILDRVDCQVRRFSQG
jgi:negative regulator of sigma E activity